MARPPNITENTLYNERSFLKIQGKIQFYFDFSFDSLLLTEEGHPNNNKKT